MATATLTNTPTVITLCNVITGFTGDTFVLEPDSPKLEGTNSVACAQTISGNNDVIFTKATGSWDFSNGEHLRLPYFSAMLNSNGDTAANGGVRVGLSDGTNTDWFYVSGSDTYKGGWERIVLYTLTTPDIDNNANLAAITSITLRIVTTSKPRNVNANLWLDAWYYGDGYTVTGGTSGDPISLTEIAAVDLTNAYGILEEDDEVFFGAGKVKVGDGISATYFEPTGQKLQFRDLPVASTLYELSFFDDASLLTNVDIQGGAWGAAGTQNWKFDASVVCNAFNMTGTQIAKLALGSGFHNGAVVNSVTFDECDMIDPDLSTFTLNAIRNSVSLATAGALYLPLTNNVNNITFDNNINDVYMDEAGTYSNNAFTHNTNTFDLAYDNASSATFNVPDAGNTATVTNLSTGTMTIVAGQKTFSFTVNPLPTPDYEWRLYTVTAVGSLDGAVELDGAEFETTATQNYVHSYTNQPVAVQIISNDYVEKVEYRTLTAADLSITINLEVDDND